MIISRLTNDVEALDQLVTDGVTTLVQSTLFLIGTSVILFLLDWRLALATLTVLPFMFLATAFFRIYSARAYRAVRERLGLVTATLAEDISGMRVVQAFRRERANEKNFHAVNAHYREANQQTVLLNGLYFPAVDFLSAAATAIVLGYGGYLVFDGDLTVGTLFAFVLYLSNFFDPVQQLSQLYNTFLSAVAALDNIMNVMDEEPEVRDKGAAKELDRIEGDVGFENVRFGYGDGPEVLHGIDLAVPAGTTVALVGHTGAGKSTIAKLLARFYDPRDGRITIDGVDLRDVKQTSLRRQLGVVPQEGFLFAGTVRDNIAFGRPDADPADVAAAAKAVGAHEFILALEDGYETNLQERGTRLSLGQRQLIAFARALLAESADPDPRRGDLVGRHRHRAADRERAPHAARRPDRVRDRAPAVDDPRRRPDRRPRARCGRRAGHARGADGPPRSVHLAVRGLGRGRVATMPLPLRTERLLLRAPTPDDLDAWHEIYLDAEEVWFGAPRSSLDENRAKLLRQIGHHEQHGFGMCTVEVDGETIGAAGLQPLEGGPEIEVGYRFLKEHWGNGYATESAKASLDVGLRRARPGAHRRGRAGDERRLQAGAREVRNGGDRPHARLRPGAREVRASPLESGVVAGSSNGRTPGSGPGSLGSNPSPAVALAFGLGCAGGTPGSPTIPLL